MVRKKELIKNQRPTSLLNTDLKTSKDFAAELIFVLLSLIASHQTAYVQNKYIGEARRLISDILDTSCHLSGIDDYLFSVVIEKGLNPLDHGFLPVL